MRAYKVSTKHKSSKKHIEFFASPDNADFRAACESAFLVHGFTIEYDGNYLYVTHPDQSSPFSDISIESDEWGLIWGEASPWGSDDENRSGIELLEKILKTSGKFISKTA